MASTSLATYMTMIEFANEYQNKMLLDIVTTMKANPLVTDAKWTEANGLNSHTFLKAAAYPAPSPRLLNAGVVPSISQTQPYTEPIFAFEKHINVDEKFESLAGSDFPRFRWNQGLTQMEGFSREFMRLFLYGIKADVLGEPDGLMTRYGTVADANVHDNGSTTDDVCSSVLMVKWGQGGVYLTYPKGSRSNGISRDPRGKVLLVTNSTTGAQAWFWNTVMTLDFGICVEKAEAVQRLGSIDTINTVDPDFLVDMAANIYEEYGTYDDVVLYMNARTWGQLWKENNARPGLLVKTQDPFGNPVWSFDGIRIKLFGGLTTTEDDI